MNSKIIGCFYIKFEILQESLLLVEKIYFRCLNFSKKRLDTERIITCKQGSTED